MKNKKIHLTPYLFILPAFVIHLALVTLPSLSTLVMSLYEWNGLGAAKFIGLDNFKEIAADPMVKQAILHNIEWLLVFITVPLILGFVVAIIVSQLNRGQMIFRTTFFIPYVISAAVGFNQVFAKLGWDGLAKTLWLGNPKIALYSVAFVDNWHWWGFIMVLFLGALQQVDSELYEAARVDGANRFQELLHVSIPGIRPTIAFVLIMTIMWSFLTFDYVYIMTNGGPANATEIMSTYIYKNAFTKYRAGYANALCVIQCGICIILYFVQKVISEKGGIENG